MNPVKKKAQRPQIPLWKCSSSLSLPLHLSPGTRGICFGKGGPFSSALAGSSQTQLLNPPPEAKQAALGISEQTLPEK